MQGVPVAPAFLSILSVDSAGDPSAADVSVHLGRKKRRSSAPTEGLERDLWSLGLVCGRNKEETAVLLGVSKALPVGKGDRVF